MPLNNIEQEVMKEYGKKFESVSGGINPWKFKHCTPDWRDLEELNSQVKSFISQALSKAYEEGKRDGVEKGWKYVVKAVKEESASRKEFEEFIKK